MPNVQMKKCYWNFTCQFYFPHDSYHKSRNFVPNFGMWQYKVYRVKVVCFFDIFRRRLVSLNFKVVLEPKKFQFSFQLFMIDNCADDWRISMTWQRITQIGIEMVICAVHPIPGEYYFLWTTKLSNHGGKIGSQWVPVDVVLSLPMFFRLYLIAR